MEKPGKVVRSYLAELAWAFLLCNAFAAAVGLLVGVHIGDVTMGLAVFLGGCATVTLLLGLVVAATLAGDALAGARERRRSRTRKRLGTGGGLAN